MTPITRIEIPIPYPVKWVNCYYVSDAAPALIDTGVNAEDSFEVLRTALRDLGASVAHIRRIIVTHGHMDHAGLAGRIQAESGAEIFIHPRDSIMGLAGPSRRMKDVGESYRLFLSQAGVPETTVPALVESILHRFKTFFSPLSSESWMKDGQEIVFDDFTLQVIHTPGHSPGSVCLLNKADGTLFSGDTLLREIFHSPASRVSDSEEYPRFNTLSEHLASLNRLKSLPVARVMPGHGASFSAHDRRVQQILGHHGRRSQEILRIVKTQCVSRGHQTGATPFTVAGDLFPGLSGIDVFFGVSSVRGHLDFLEDQGLVTAVVHRSPKRYYPVRL